MGTDETEAYPPERPAHPVRVDGFWIDAHEVTNDDFAAFVRATGYVTVAERRPDPAQLRGMLPAGSPEPAAVDVSPGSMVFVKPVAPASTDDPAAWWRWVPGADWRHPEGPASDLQGRGNHPVVQVAYEDAEAYATWAGKAIPTEAEWEFAARGGLDRKRYAWGDQVRPGGRVMANTWQGTFPHENLREDGFEGTSPAGSFPPNGHGLFDMIGNVWEWTADWYADDTHAKTAAAGGVAVNPRGPQTGPGDPRPRERVTKGGSFLCAENFCLNYRPSARIGTAWDTGASNVGFRCVKRGAAP